MHRDLRTMSHGSMSKKRAAEFSVADLRAQFRHESQCAAAI